MSDKHAVIKSALLFAVPEANIQNFIVTQDRLCQVQELQSNLSLQTLICMLLKCFPSLSQRWTNSYLCLSK